MRVERHRDRAQTAAGIPRIGLVLALGGFLLASSAAAQTSFFAVPQCRILDTRNAADGPQLSGGAERTFQVTGRCGVPAGAAAVSLNVAVVNPSTFGFLQAYAAGRLFATSTSTVNFQAGANQAASAIRPLSAAGRLGVFLPNFGGTTAHLILDVNGYFSSAETPAPGATGPLFYRPLAGCRLFDSVVPGNVSTWVDVQGECAVPLGAEAAALSVKFYMPDAGHALLFGTGTGAGGASINFFPPRSVHTNGVVTRLGPSSGDLTASIFAVNGGSARLALDAEGYFTSAGGLPFVPLQDGCRAFDGTIGNGGPWALNLRCGAIPATGVGALAATVTIAGRTHKGSVVLRPPSFPAGTATVLEFPDGSAGELATGAIVATADDARAWLDLRLATVAGENASARVIVDVFGYFLELEPIVSPEGRFDGHLNRARGIRGGAAYQLGDVDHVNLYNGNLTLRLPLGGRYPVSESFDYGLQLTYNSNVWDLRPVGNPLPGAPENLATFATTTRGKSNAGLGWVLSLGNGRLFPAGAPETNPFSNESLFVDADGAERKFYTGPSGRVTRDGSYLRLTEGGGVATVDRPDGVVEAYGADGKLRSLRDRFGSTVQVSVLPDRWQITDPHGRLQTVYFHTSGFAAGQVDRVELGTFGQTTAVYTFVYTPVLLPRHGKHNYLCGNPSCAENQPIPVALLASISMPEGGSYQMSYHANVAGFAQPGFIRTLTFPTGGRYEWGWGPYGFFDTVTQPNEPDSFPTLVESEGVGSKRIYLSAGGPLAGEWTYTHFAQEQAGQQLAETRTTVRTPEGDETVHYFELFHSSWDFGLPYTRRVGDGQGRYLSEEVYDGPVSAGNKLRSVYRRFESDQFIGSFNFGSLRDMNRRLASEKVVYHDDAPGGVAKFATVEYSDHDGLGHYRMMTTGGNFGAADVRSSFMRYNPESGTYRYNPETNQFEAGHSFVPPGPSEAWILDEATESRVSEGASQRRTLLCLDGATKFVRRERLLRNGASESATDVLVVRSPDGAGNTLTEQYFGGDVGAGLATGNTCGMGVPAVQYQVQHGHVCGVRNSSSWSGVSFKSLDLDIECRSGLIQASRDSAGLGTSFEYDRENRVVWEMAGPGSTVAGATFGSWVELCYTPLGQSRACNSAPPTGSANVVVREHATGSKTSSILAESQVVVDGLGRVTRERRKLPNGQWNLKETSYNAMHWVTSVSEVQTSIVGRTQFLDYDPFGRPGRIRPPDGAAHDIEILYNGVRKAFKRSRVGTSRSADGTILEGDAERVELYDRQGRLSQVKEPSSPNDDPFNAADDVETNYAYEAGGRLITVSTTTGGVNQTRAFGVDALGRLRTEDHPEMLASALGNDVNYPEYDALGNLRRRVDAVSDLRYFYDSAGRLTDLVETGGFQRVLRQLRYSQANAAGNFAKGKLGEASQFQYPVIGGVTHQVVIRHNLVYGGRDGQVSSRTTTALDNGATHAAFVQGFAYDDLGNPATIDYPQCIHLACGAPQPRQVAMAYSQGLLTQVQGWADFAYHPNLMVSRVAHANGRVWEQTLEPHGMARPFEIKMDGVVGLGPYRYDGAGNVVKVGGEYNLYDRVGRLVRSNMSSGEFQTYRYDAFGNILEIAGTSGRMTPTNSATNRVSSPGTSYDGAGNLRGWAGQSYEYDAFHRMTRKVSGGREWLYFYDVDGERVWQLRTAAGATPRLDRFTLRGLDGKVLRVYEAVDGANWTVAEDYIHRGGRLLATITPAGGVRHLHLDHLGTPRLTSNAAGQNVAGHHYYGFGEEAFTSNDAEPMKFTGHERDLNDTSSPADDLDYTHARFYNPFLGRFGSPDPLNGNRSDPRSWNRYSYALDNPVKYVDPDGEAPAPTVSLKVLKLSATVPIGKKGIGIKLDLGSDESAAPTLSSAGGAVNVSRTASLTLALGIFSYSLAVETSTTAYVDDPVKAASSPREYRRATQGAVIVSNSTYFTKLEVEIDEPVELKAVACSGYATACQSDNEQQRNDQLKRPNGTCEKGNSTDCGIRQGPGGPTETNRK